MLNEEAKKERVVYAYIEEDNGGIDWDVFFEDIEQDEDIIIYGNKDYKGTNNDILGYIDTFIDNYNYYCNNECYYRNITEYVESCFSKDNGKKFSKKELSTIKNICENYDYKKQEEYYCEILSIIKCKPYERFCLKGYCQGDWQYMYAPKDISETYLNWIGAIYFGKANEVAISNDLSFEDCCWNLYTHDIIWNETELIEAIKKDTGADKVVLCDKKAYTTYEYVEKGAE